MQSKPIVFILLAASALFAAALVLKNAKPFARDWRAARVGVVRDAASGQPIAGAFVVARWLERSAPRFDTSGVIAGRCLDRVVARSDADGRFAIPARADDGPLDADWNPTRAHTYARDLQVYANGYVVLAQDSGVADGNPVVADSTHDEAPITLALHSEQGDAGQRLARLADAAQGFACDGQLADAPVAEAIDADGYALACLSTGGSENTFARLRAALRGRPAAIDAHPCAAQHTVSTTAP